MGVDLGTYHVRVEFADGTGFIEKWNTGMRYCGGGGGISPVDAGCIPPTFKDAAALADTVLFSYTEGNDSCDCNKKLSLDRANQIEPEEHGCGDELEIKRLTLILPNGNEFILLGGEEDRDD